MRPPEFEIRQGDALDVLRKLPDGIAQACVTSPPYYNLRDYGHDEQLGRERTVGEYVERLAEILGEAGRVLRDDGTLWLNLGDTYATSGGPRSPSSSGLQGTPQPARTGSERTRSVPTGIKPKDLIGVPWRVAFALQDAGWWLRKAIIWDKPNPIPEAVTDRPTSSHELVFLLTKAPTYFYDLDGHREPLSNDTLDRLARRRADGPGVKVDASRNDAKPDMAMAPTADGRQARDVWRIPTVPFPGTHFAVFPPELPRRCIVLGTSPRACHACSSPWTRVFELRLDENRPQTRRALELLAEHDLTPEHVEAIRAAGITDAGKALITPTGAGRNTDAVQALAEEAKAALGGYYREFLLARRDTVAWRPTCACGAPPDVAPGDLDVIGSPLVFDGRRADPSQQIGRAGLARERQDGEGRRAITRYEQRHLARQLASSPHRFDMEAHAGRETFAHYLRTDRTGARPPRHDLLEAWRSRGWIAEVQVPEPWWDENDASRCLVLDPFAGAGTTGMVAVAEGRDFLGIELNLEYAAMARDRVAGAARTPAFEFLA